MPASPQLGGTPGSAPARERLLDALLDEVVENGYPGATVQGVCARAGAEREDFNRCFPSLEDCAVAVLDRVMERIEPTVRRAYESQERWPDSLRAFSYATARWIVENPKETRFAAVGLLAAGEMAQARREAGFRTFLDVIDAGRLELEDPDSVPALTAERVIGSFATMLTHRIPDQQFNPYDFVPELMYMAVRPYLGAEAARRELSIPPPPGAEEEGG
jgi:AcrR family transcriptional regulator